MSTPDLNYMNERISFIANAIREAYNLYCFLSEQDKVTEQEYKRLSDIYTTANTAIKDYYSYLHKVNINPEDSYLTAMLEKQDAGDKLYEVGDFLWGFKKTSPSEEQNCS